MFKCIEVSNSNIRFCLACIHHALRHLASFPCRLSLHNAVMHYFLSVSGVVAMHAWCSFHTLVVG